MARDHAYVPPSLWHRPQFRDLAREVQQLYLLLLTHPQLSLCGVVDWRPARLTAFAGDGTVEDVSTAAKVLIEAGLIAVDDETEEALVRSFVRDDGLLLRPNVAKGMVRQFGDLTSLHLRETFLQDLRALHDEHRPRVVDADGKTEPKGWQHVFPLLHASPGEPSPEGSAAAGEPFGKGSEPSGDPSSRTGLSVLGTRSSVLAAAAPAAAAALDEPSAPAPAALQQHDPVEDLQAALDALGGHDVQWRLTDEERVEVAALLERHGQARLVEAAVAQGKPPAHARAWLGRWRDLRGRPKSARTTPFTECHDHPGQPAGRCPQCIATGVEMPEHFRQVRAELRRGRRPAPVDDETADDTGDETGGEP